MSETITRASVREATSYSHRFQVGWSSGGAPSISGARIANTSLRPSQDGSTSRTSPSPCVNSKVTLRSGALGEARSRT